MATGRGFDRTQPFTHGQGLAAGLTASQLRGPGFVRLHRNVYVARETQLTLTLRARGALLNAPPGAFISHNTATALWDGVIPGGSGGSLHVTISRPESFEVEGMRTHQSTVERAVTALSGLLVTTPEQTFVDMAGHLDLVDLVTLGDRLVRRKRTSPMRLLQFAHAWEGRHREAALGAAAFVRAGVDSPPESRLRMLIMLAGLPEPVVNHIERDPKTGDWLRRFELAYPEPKIAIEYDGRQHRENDEIWAKDLDRREQLDRQTWRIVKVVNKDLYETPLRTLQRIAMARSDRGAPRLRRLDDAWKAHFPGRG